MKKNEYPIVRLNLPTKLPSMRGKKRWKALLSEYFPLVIILAGIVLVSIIIGPFQNEDTQLEYAAALGVIRWGMPYTKYAGDLINQPPLGFYTASLFFQFFGLSFENGVTLVTLFGLGSTILVYKIGENWYGKRTGLFAAALFALTPWQLAFSRSFLIDVQCMFFSLLFLFVGIRAIRKDSFKLFMISGILFAIALLTKFYAIFALIPLASFYLYYGQKNLRRPIAVVAYFFPVIFLSFLWYCAMFATGLLSVVSHSTLSHDDFQILNPPGTIPSYFFVGIFLLDGVGALFIIAAFLSLLICFSRRKLFANFFPYDLICLVTIVAVGSINTLLGAGLNLSFPYNNAAKYDYQFLPFLSLLAASLAGKFLAMFNLEKAKEKLDKLLFYSAGVGLILLAISILLNMNSVHNFSISDFLLFRVEFDKIIGYSFVNSTPIGKHSPLEGFQYIGFAFVLVGLFWVSRDKLGLLRKVAVQNKWRLAFLALVIIYAFLLLLDLSTSPIQSDEITHLNGGIRLLRGQSPTCPEMCSFCPNLFDVVTSGFFKVVGTSVFSSRLVSVVFSLLLLWVVFEFSSKMYGSKVGLVSSILFGIMPGYFWLSRMALIETMYVFFFTLSLLFFFKWLRSQQIWLLALSGVALGLGFLTKYQVLIVEAIMIAGILILCRRRLASKFLRFTLLMLILVLLAILLINESYQIFTAKMPDQRIYTMQLGTPEKLIYSTRFECPEWLQLPIFYLIEMTWSYNDFHPISFFLYIIGLVGLGFFGWRRKDEDKLLLAWFFIVYIFFTLIANKQWHHVIPIFPVLAISAASLISFVKDKIKKSWKSE